MKFIILVRNVGPADCKHAETAAYIAEDKYNIPWNVDGKIINSKSLRVSNSNSR